MLQCRRSGDTGRKGIGAGLQSDSLATVLRIAVDTVVDDELATGISTAVVQRDGDGFQSHTASVVKIEAVDSHIDIRQVDEVDAYRCRFAQTSVVIVTDKVGVGGAEGHLVAVVGNLPEERGIGERCRILRPAFAVDTCRRDAVGQRDA